MKIDPNKILNEVRELGFEEVWLRSAELLPSIGKGLMLTGRGTAHPVADLVEKLREAFLGMGFNETLLPTIVEEDEVYKQYGPEAPIILDRCYYLATLPRPDIGLSREKCDRIRGSAYLWTKEVLRPYRRYFMTTSAARSTLTTSSRDSCSASEPQMPMPYASSEKSFPSSPHSNQLRAT